ncbi:MAG TPA: bifunctional 4-hydroxy-2-oxoglutarate aldolase/2-dehydro-3-deoxy-phosphogluconate aldolase [Xanthomonadales bacterium]|nr:bifunctional 4-hydroxy-2-oxoglutarate aldolase/2-dehydro-3-deoxy-phosphogluconate aldolase [Xanthomonadales bacterium]
MSGADERIEDLLALAPVLPLLTVDDAASAVAAARALVRGGLRAIEVTLRTPAALDAIAAIRRDVPDAIPGAGTVLTPAHLADAQRAGAAFVVSPGFTPRLADAIRAAGAAWLPGVATASELMFGIEAGFASFKLFPAASAGTALLRAWLGPFPHVRFCPTGGIDAANAAEWLALRNVACVGGSWIAPPAAIKAGDWDAVESRARAAAALKRASLR